MNKISIYHQLLELGDNIKKMDEDELKETVDLLKGINFEEIVKYLLTIDKLDDMDLVTIRKIIEITQFIYNNTAIDSPITDEDFDKLYQLMLDKGLGDIVGSTNIQGKKLRRHQYPMLRGTINKIHFMTKMEKNALSIKDEGNKITFKETRLSLEEWLNSVENILGEKIPYPSVTIQPKHDGLSVVHECDKYGNILHSLLRGDTDKNIAVEVTAIFKDRINFKEYAKKNKPFGIKTETVMERQQFDNFCLEQKKYNNPRSAVSSILNEKELRPELGRYLTVMPLRQQYYGENEIIILNSAFDEHCDNIYNIKEIEYKINLVNSYIRENGLVTDGVVLYLDDPSVQRRLGRIGAINRFEVAYKFPAQQKRTKLIDVEFTVGLGGCITPVAKFEQVIMNGNEISSASLGSIDRFKSLNLHKGDEVIIKYEIIPYLDVDASCNRNINGKVFKVPTHCKYCGCELEEDPVLKCVNNNCSSRIIGNIVNYITKMRIEGISIGKVTTLFDKKILTNIESLYTLREHKEEIISIPGFGLKSYQNIIDGIDAKKECYDYELLGSLGIPNIGERIFKKVLTVMDLDKLIEVCKEGYLIGELIGVSGFGEKTCTKIQRGINEKLNTIEFLLNKLNVKKYNRSSKGKICFSKIRDKDLEKSLVEKGYEITNSITKDTKYLIVPSLDAVSSKTVDALKKDVEIITLDEAYKIL